MLRVWGSELGCGGRCREVLGEMWEKVLGCGVRCGKVLGRGGEMLGRCGKVCWGVEKVRGDVGKCVEVWGEV